MKAAKICDLNAALSRMGGSVELVQQVAAFFHEDYPPLLEKLKAAALRTDAPAVQQAAHSLKGLVVSFDGNMAAAAAEKIERGAMAGNLGDVNDLVANLETELDRLVRQLAVDLPKLKP